MTKDAVKTMYQSLMETYQQNGFSHDLAARMSLYTIQNALVQWVGSPETCVCRQHGRNIVDRDCVGCRLAEEEMRYLFKKIDWSAAGVDLTALSPESPRPSEQSTENHSCSEPSKR